MKESFLLLVSFSVLMMVYNISSSVRLVDWLTPASPSRIIPPWERWREWPLEALVWQLSQLAELTAVCYHAFSQQGSKPRS